MRRDLSLVTLATVSALTLVGSMTHTSGRSHLGQLRLQGRKWGYPGNCQFST